MVNPNEDTEFNDALRAHGILPPKPPSRTPSPDIPHITHEDAVRAIAATADTTQLDTLLEADNIDSDDERMFEDYKRKRMAEIKNEEKRGRYGTMEPLGREDFVREVTEGSKVDPDGLSINGTGDDDDEEGQGEQSGSRGTGVVVFLFKDCIPLSQHLRPLLVRLASAHPATKFLSISAGLCIPDYPDKNVPTLLTYRNGEMIGNVVAGMGLRGMQTTVQDLEGLLLRYRAIDRPSLALRPRRETQDADLDDDLDEEIGTVNARSGGLRGGGGLSTGPNTRRIDDSDESDLDL